MLPLLPFYAAILVVLSVFFAPNLRETLPPPPESFVAISHKVSTIFDAISFKMNQAEEATESVADAIISKVEAAASCIHSEIVYNLFDEPVVEAVNPNVAQWTPPDWTQPYADLAIDQLNNVYQFVKEYLTLVYTITTEYAEIIYSHLVIVFNEVIQLEPINTWINEYQKIHTTYITPLVDYAIELYSTSLEPLLVKFFKPAIEDFAETWESLSTGENTLPGPVLYAVVVLLLYVFIILITKFSKIFMKDLFWVNQGVNTMYGPTSPGLFAAVGGERGEVYDSMKTKEDLIRDEIEELENELNQREGGIIEIEIESSSSSIERGDGEGESASNHSTNASKRASGSKRAKQRQRQEQGKESQKKTEKKSLKPHTTSQGAANAAVGVSPIVAHKV